MKWFPDDYHTDGVDNKMKKARGLFYHYEFFRSHTDLGWRPSLDLYETEKHFVILVDLAGMKKEDVVIDVGWERVQLRGNRCRPSEDAVTRIHHMEIHFGPYDQDLPLPEPVDPHGATSSYRDGFLHIRLPKERSKEISNG